MSEHSAANDLSQGGFDPSTLTGPLAFRWDERAVISASGPDAEAYLQGQLSQDVAALSTGGTAWSLLLQPQGKVDSWMRVTRTDDQTFLLDMDAAAAEGTVVRLQRFLLRTDCVIERLAWRSLSLRGSRADDSVVAGNAELVAQADDWAGGGLDVFGPDLSVEGSAEAKELSAQEWTALRIISGVPAMGPELGPDTIPASAGVVDRSVSFTKGCYTGQELVARIDSRGGNVPRRLCFAAFGPGVSGPATGAAVTVDGDEVGTITSSAPLADGRTVALAYISRKVVIEDGAAHAVTAEGADGQLTELRAVSPTA